MPKAFELCRKKGGKIRTISGPNKSQGLAADEYVHICILGGFSTRGHVKKKKAK